MPLPKYLILYVVLMEESVRPGQTDRSGHVVDKELTIRKGNKEGQYRQQIYPLTIPCGTQESSSDCSPRKLHTEFTTYIRRGFNQQIRLVPEQHMLDDGQAKPGALGFA